ncbi:MAG: phosphoribosylamine--glycine ligase [Phycisphaerales bacterium]|nr:phosphoribosylamine--glycine ligase [Phycisphaerales bacterium]
MKILLIGSGGREHALAWKIKQSPLCTRLFIAPGNPGMTSLGELLPIKANDVMGLVKAAADVAADLVVVGPEDPLAMGLADALQEKKIKVFGPSKAGAALEADKAFSKKMMRDASIPTAEGRAFSNFKAALAFVETRIEPLVVKAAGLAKGKGVIVCNDPVEAIDAVRNIMEKKVFGDAGNSVVIEERLEGPEVSLLAFVDGTNAYLLEGAQDHKRIGDNDTGPNTGGMGAYSPAPLLTDHVLEKVEREVIVPLMDSLKRSEIDFRGILYTGLMLTAGGPKVLEFNARFGDPECQPLMMRLKSDLVEVMLATVEQKLDQITLKWDPRTAVCVVLASEGYGWKSDDQVTKGVEITGLDAASKQPDVMIFHGGTAMKSGKLVTSGGRVLGVTALGDSVPDARAKAAAAIEKIHFAGMQWRKDIGAKAKGK